MISFLTFKNENFMLHYLALNEIRGIGPAHIEKLLQLYGNVKEIFNQSTKELTSKGLSLFCAESIVKKSTFEIAEKYLIKAEQQGLKIITLQCKEYSDLLKEIYMPPPVLYIKGNEKLLRSMSSLGIVGTRNPDSYGKRAVESIVEELVSNKMTIVSGMAAGIDTLAHKECLKSGGNTIAVLGTGADIVYPERNRELSHEISEKGLIISEFPPGTFPARYNFPKRNRIISGLSLGTLVVQAKSRSGSLITAHHALQQDREVFAVPGDIFNDKCDGTFRLLKDGAIPVKSAGDILSSLSIQHNLFKNKEIVSTACSFPIDLLNDDERILFEIITTSPQRIDELSDKIPDINSQIFTLLLDLELKGLIRQVSGQQYVLA